MFHKRFSGAVQGLLRAKERSLILGLCAASVLSAVAAGCGGGKATPTLSQVADVVVAQNQRSIGPEGGQVSLPSGVTLTVPQGALPAEVTVTLKQLEKPKYFGESAIAYEIQGLGSLIGTAKLIIPVGEVDGKTPKKEEISILLYDESSQYPEPFQVKELDFEYDAISGKAIVDISPSMNFEYAAAAGKATVDIVPSMKQSRSPLLERFRILFQKEPYYSPQSSEKLLPMPYYEQVGNSCWAASCLMLARAFKTDPPGFHLGKILAYVKASDDDFGLGIIDFQTTMLHYLAVYSKATVKWRGYASITSLRSRMLRELDAGHPLILRMSKWGTAHAVLVVGYRDNGEKFILHDPKGAMPPDDTDGGAYTVRDLKWIDNQRTHRGVAMQVAWVDSALPSSRTLQTVGCPGRDEKGDLPLGEMKFYGINLDKNREEPISYLQFRPSAINGYTWVAVRDMKSLSEMPSTTTKLHMDVPVWNASREQTSVRVKIALYTGSTRLTWESRTLDLSPAADNTTVKRGVVTDIELGPPGTVRRYDLADDKGIQKVNIDVRLEGMDGSYRDSFDLDVNLSLLPVISKLEPTQVKPGEEVTINGICFGDRKSSKGGVLLNGKALQIVSWSDRKIVAKVPTDAASGDLVVTTGERHRYTSNSVPLTIATTVEKTISEKWDYNLRNFDTTFLTFDNVKAKYGIDAKIEMPVGAEFSRDELPGSWVAYLIKFPTKLPASLPPVRVVATITGLTASNGFIDPESGFKDNGAPPDSDGYGYVRYSVKRYEFDATGLYGRPIDPNICTITMTEPSKGVYRAEFEVDSKKLDTPGTGYRVTLEVRFYYRHEIKDPGEKQPYVRENALWVLQDFHFHIYRE